MLGKRMASGFAIADFLVGRWAASAFREDRFVWLSVWGKKLDTHRAPRPRAGDARCLTHRGFLRNACRRFSRGAEARCGCARRSSSKWALRARAAADLQRPWGHRCREGLSGRPPRNLGLSHGLLVRDPGFVLALPSCLRLGVRSRAAARGGPRFANLAPNLPNFG